MSINENVYAIMEQKNIFLPEPPAKGGAYAQAKEFSGNLIYISGCGPDIANNEVKGKLGIEFDIDDGKVYSRNCILNILAVLQAKIDDLNKVKRVVKITTFVAGSNDFYNQPQVANGGSELLIEIFGLERGTPSRSAVGVNALPGNIPVEIEALFEI